jgi:hypothetical protein
MHPKVLARTPEGKRPFARSRRRWEGNIKMDLIDMSCENIDWIQLVQGSSQWWAFVIVIMKLRIP